ncbi:ATP biosynthetic process, variant 2 [Balamuthia mandrillaris]
MSLVTTAITKQLSPLSLPFLPPRKRWKVLAPIRSFRVHLLPLPLTFRVMLHFPLDLVSILLQLPFLLLASLAVESTCLAWATLIMCLVFVMRSGPKVEKVFAFLPLGLYFFTDCYICEGVLGQVLNFASSLQQQQTSVHVPSTSHSGISIFQTSPGSYEAPSNNTTSSTSSTKKSRGHRRKGMVGGGWQDVTPLSSNNGIAASQHQQQQRPNYDVYDSSSSDEDDDEEYDEETRVEASALFMGLSASDNNATSSNDPPQNNNGEKIATKNTNLLLDLFDDELPKAGSPSHSVISNSTPPLVQNGAVKAAPSSSPSSSLFSGMNVYEEQEQEHEQSSQQASTAGLIFDFINPSPSSPSSSSSSFSSSASSSSSSSSSAKSSSLLEHGIASQLADLNFSSSSSTFISRKTTTSTTPTTTTVKVQPNVIANNPAIALTSYASTVPSGYYVYPTITPLSSYSSHHMVSPPLSSSSSSTSFSPVGARRTSSSPSLLQTANSSIPEDGNADELSSNFSFVIAHTKKNASSSSSSTRVAARGKGERSGASSDAFSFVQDAIKANTGVHNT